MLTCKSCGAALDLAMSACPECGVGVELGRLTGILGIVCRACDAYNDPGARSCVGCGKPIGAGIAPAPPAAPAPAAPTTPAPAVPVVAAPAASPPASPPAPPAPPAVAAAFPAAPPAPAVRPPAPAAPPPVAPRAPPAPPLRTPLIGTMPALGAPTPPPRPAPPPAAAQPPAPRQPAPPPGSPVVRTYQRGAGVTRVIPLARAGGQASIPCPRCGEVAGGGQYCQRCGQPLGPQAAPPAPASAPAPAARPGHSEPASGRAAPASGQAEAAAGHPDAPAGRARIHLERGEGPEGVTFRLGAEVVEAGRSRGEVVFPADPCLAPHHATFFYRDGALHVRDEGAAGGIYLRLRGPSAPLRPGDHFAVGDRLLRFAGFLPPAPPGPDDGTRRLGAPRHGGPTALVEEWLEGGIIGRVFVRAGPSITIGRAGCAISLGDDPYLSQAHAELVLEGEGQARLRDLGSANGTYLRVPSHAERELHDGDGLRLGREVLRVSIA